MILKKFGQHVDEMMAVAVKKNSEFLMVMFSYNQTKTLTWPPMQFSTVV